jgi:outer membrane protein assembly factor BamB
MKVTRRRLLAALAVGGAGAGAFYATRGGAGDGVRCAPLREPSWDVTGRDWTQPVRGPNGVLVGEGFAATGGNYLNRIGSFQNDEPRWVYTVEGDGVGVPFADDDLVAVGTGSDRVHAFEQPTGHHRWTYDAGGREEYGGGAWGQPAHVDGGVVVAVSHSEQADPDPQNPDDYTHRLLALEDADGSVRWECAIDGVAFTGPAVHDGTAVVATEAGGVHGVGVATGDRLWRDNLPGTVWAPLALDPGRGTVTVGSDEGSVVSFDVASGERKWTRTFDSGVAGTTRAAGRVVVSLWDGRLLALGEGDGKTDWKVNLGSAGGPVDAAAGHVATLDQTGVVHVLADAGGVLTEFRVTEGSGDRCGWRPKANSASGVLLDQVSVVVTGASWLREYDLDLEE